MTDNAALAALLRKFEEAVGRFVEDDDEDGENWRARNGAWDAIMKAVCIVGPESCVVPLPLMREVLTALEANTSSEQDLWPNSLPNRVRAALRAVEDTET